MRVRVRVGVTLTGQLVPVLVCGGGLLLVARLVVPRGAGVAQYLGSFLALSGTCTHTSAPMARHWMRRGRNNMGGGRQQSTSRWGDVKVVVEKLFSIDRKIPTACGQLRPGLVCYSRLSLAIIPHVTRVAQPLSPCPLYICQLIPALVCRCRLWFSTGHIVPRDLSESQFGSGVLFAPTILREVERCESM